MAMIQYVLVATFAFTLTFFLTLAAFLLFPKLGLLDRPAKYGLKRKPIPYYGGLAIFLGFVISVLLFVKIDLHLIGLLVGASMVMMISFLDDFYGLSPWLRLAVQMLAAVVLVVAGIGIHTISNPLGPALNMDQWIVTIDRVYQLSVFSALFTIVWVVGIVNTMNFLDGLNGLPSGVTVIAAFTLFLLSIRPDIHYDISSQTTVALLSLILFGCALAFWLFDFYPAKILMGDTGSMFLGFLLANLAIFSGGKIATAFLVLGFPILDAGWVIVRRIVQGKSPLKGDRKHLHHRLLEVGLSDRKALIFIYVLCAVFGGIAVFLEGIQKLYAIIALAILMAILGWFAVYYKRKRMHKF